MRQTIATPPARAEIRTWPLDASIHHLVILDVAMVPTAEQIQQWLDTAYLAADGAVAAHRLRTSALYPTAAAVFEQQGFEVVDRLTLLERPLLGSTTAPPVRRSTQRRLRRVHGRALPTLAAIDQAAFATGWQNDAASLADIVSATPQAHSRLAVERRRAVGFAITGKAGTTGYIQRIAVRPDARRNGVGRQLLDDAVQWLMRRGASRALVNTGTDNVAALEMYAAAAFEPLPDELVVLEHRRAS